MGGVSDVQDYVLADLLAGVVVAALAVEPASAQKKYDPGASDTEIKIGQTMPYSGPASSYGTIGLAKAAYFEKVNAEGGVNGRKITLLSRDDGYQSSKTVEMTRMLVEQDEVLFMAASLGTAPNIAVQKYLNGKKVPQFFVATGATRWSDPANFPWTMGWQPSYQIEGADPRPLHVQAPIRPPRSASCIRTTIPGRTTSRDSRPGSAMPPSRSWPKFPTS